MRGQRHAPAALPRERPGTHCTGGWVGPKAVLDGCGKILPPPGFDPPDRPTRSESQYKLRYPDSLKLMYHKGNNKHNFSINTYNIVGMGAVPAEAKETVEHHTHNTRDTVRSL